MWRGLSVDNLLLVFTVLSCLIGGIWKGSEINTTLALGIENETNARIAAEKATDLRFELLSKSVGSVAQDVRELRSYVMDEYQFPPNKRSSSNGR
jgi:hypothetical protein